MRSLVYVPIICGDSGIGALGLGTRERDAVSETQIELLQTFAEQAAIAINLLSVLKETAAAG